MNKIGLDREAVFVLSANTGSVTGLPIIRRLASPGIYKSLYTFLIDKRPKEGVMFMDLQYAALLTDIFNDVPAGDAWSAFLFYYA